MIRMTVVIGSWIMKAAEAFWHVLYYYGCNSTGLGNVLELTECTGVQLFKPGGLKSPVIKQKTRMALLSFAMFDL